MTIFGPDQLAQLAAAIPPDLPEGYTSAIVGGVDQTGAQVVVGFRRDFESSTWQATGAFRHTWTGDNQVGAQFIVSF